MRLVGYARVSTFDQDTALQLDALRKAGVSHLFSENASGIGARPQLHKALESVVAGDVFVVWKIDRIARSLGDFLSILNRLRAEGVALRSLTEPIDTSTPLGEFMLQVLGAIAQLERAMIRERTIAGQVESLRKGVRWGRPRALNEAERVDALARRLCGERADSIAAHYGVSASAVNRAIRAELGYAQLSGLAKPVLGKYLAQK